MFGRVGVLGVGCLFVQVVLCLRLVVFVLMGRVCLGRLVFHVIILILGAASVYY